MTAKACAVVLLSGGIDSAVTLAEAQQRGHTCHALSFDYGQRHHIELEAARDIANIACIEHHTIRVDLTQFGGSALIDHTIAVPRDQFGKPGIPATYVPARNTIFLSHALAYAETIGARDLYIGCNRDDWDGYPDCRPEYLNAYEVMANYATALGSPMYVHAPLIGLNKADIVRRGHELGVNFAATWSCYDPAPDGWPCRQCDACLLRTQAFAEAGIDDPAANR
jgi:7-cyano-7-deazaguanine synthase